MCAETGWLVLLAFLTSLGSIVFAGWRAINRNDRWLSPYALGLTAAMVGQVVHMPFDIFNSRIQIQFLFLVVALTVAIANLLGTEQVESDLK